MTRRRPLRHNDSAGMPGWQQQKQHYVVSAAAAVFPNHRLLVVHLAVVWFPDVVRGPLLDSRWSGL
jgi:hypothetical protein